MTRRRSRAHSINLSVSVPEDGDGTTRRGISESKAPFPKFCEVVAPPGKCGSFLGKKQQNQQNSAREHPALSIQRAEERGMMAGSTQRPERLTRNNALLLLVDHQIGLYTGIRDIDVLQLKHNIVGLTRAMRALKVPVIVTTTTEKMWGPLIPE